MIKKIKIYIYGVEGKGIGIIAEADIIASKSYTDIAEGKYNKYYGSEDYKKNDKEVNGLIVGARDANKKKDIKDEYNKLQKIYDSIDVSNNNQNAFNDLYEKSKTKLNEYETNEIVKIYHEKSKEYYDIINYNQYRRKWYEWNEDNIYKYDRYKKIQNFMNEYNDRSTWYL